jgi:hypothetical protein
MSYETEQHVPFSILLIQSGKFYTHYKLCARQNNQTTVLCTSPTLTSALLVKRLEILLSGDGKWKMMMLLFMRVFFLHPAPLFVGRVVGGGVGSDEYEAQVVLLVRK